MRKLFITICMLIQAPLLFAQDLISKIPVKANVVGTINTGKLMQMMTEEEWSNSNFGKKILEMSGKNADEPTRSFNDLGLSLNGNTYYFHTENDSMHYNYILAPVSDAAKFDALFKNKAFVKLANNTRLSANEDSSGFMIWNNQQLLYARGFLKESYFSDYTVAANHGLYVPHYYSDTTVTADSTYTPKIDYDEPVVDSVIAEVGPPVVQEPLPPPPPKTKKSTTTKKKETASKKKSNTAKKEKVKKTEPEIAEEEKVPEYDTYVTIDTTPTLESTYPSYDYQKEVLIKQRIAAACTETVIKDLFAKTPDTSIAANPEYMKTTDANAVATIWIDRPMELYYSTLGSFYMYGRGLGNNFFNRTNNALYNNFTAKMYLEEKQIRLTSAAEMPADMVAMQQKIFSRKLNKKILNYVNTDSLLGYLSWSIDTKSYLESFPKLMENTYGNMGLGLSSDEYGVISELMSFLIDEEAISNLIKGDGMVIFNGIYAQPNTYTDYEYDENYNSKPVIKTKTDTLPRFLFVLSSDENSFERKMVNYGIKKEVVKQLDGYYEITIPRSPMQLYFTNKDGLFFLTNSLKDITDVTTGKYLSKISKQEKKLLLGHNYNLFVSPSKISGKLADTEIGAAESLSATMNTLRQMGNVRAVMHPIKGNVTSGEMTMELPENKSNSLKYIFEVFDGLMK